MSKKEFEKQQTIIAELKARLKTSEEVVTRLKGALEKLAYECDQNQPYTNLMVHTIDIIEANKALADVKKMELDDGN